MRTHPRAQAPVAAFALLALLSASACDSIDPTELDEAGSDSTDRAPTIVDIDNSEARHPGPDSTDDAVEEVPDFVLELEGGSSLSFFVGADGGVAMLEDVPLAAGVASVLDDPRLADASPAVVWYALTGEGEAIPTSLREHHEQLTPTGIPARSGISGRAGA